MEIYYKPGDDSTPIENANRSVEERGGRKLTYQEAEKLIDDLDRAFKAGLLKVIGLLVIGLILIFFLTPIIENLYDDLRYWWDCKKFDCERKKGN